MIILFIFFAVCYGCDWFLEHNHPGSAFLAGFVFIAVFFLDRWFNIKELESETEDDE
jgi:UDP-N-acetylmuramyl pentapeptide phosphotransferase/UDP-N-acetylglucosamine-1-phosphate transferase